MGEAEIPSLCHDSLKVPIGLLVLCSAMCRAFLMSALVVTILTKSTSLLFITHRCKGAPIMFSMMVWSSSQVPWLVVVGHPALFVGTSNTD
jgi:hypothetical protein